MAVDYYNVLKDLDVSITVIGRGEVSSKNFYSKTGFKTIVGGLNNFLITNPKKCDSVIIAVGIEELSQIAIKVINFGIKNILLEKPGGLNINDILLVKNKAKQNNANVHIAYNRRFYASTKKAKEIINKDGGVTSFNFEFTEWSDVVKSSKQNKKIKEKWFLANSSHVADLAFYLGGLPEEIKTFTSGNLSWHKSASIFSGAGRSNSGALFSYQANWESAGRWNIEILTTKNRLIFKPMEQLFLQKKGEIVIKKVEDIDYELDKKYKPGLFLQTSSFINYEFKEMLNIYDLISFFNLYSKIANYY
mgnify:CR=1 FL=1